MAIFGFLFKYNYKKIAIVSLIVLVLAVVFGFVAVPWYIRHNIKDLNLKPDSYVRKVWEKAPVPITFSVNVFNITNPIDVVRGQKPILQQIGPFVFDDWKSKNVLDDDEKEDSVTFEMIDTFHFRQDLSGSLTGDEIVTVPHLLLMGGLISIRRDRLPLLEVAIPGFQQIFETNATPFLTTTVMDLLFNGVIINCDRDEMEAGIVCAQLATEKNIKKVNATHFAISLLGDKNGTSAGKFKVNRGISDITNIGKVMTFQDSEISMVYKDQCGKLNGTDGTIFPPFHKKEENFYSFSPILCRTIGQNYIGDSSYHGISTTIYRLEFDDYKNDKRKHCFCRHGNPELCPPQGTLDTYQCNGIPLIISKPHFLDADKELLKLVDGLKPVRRLHDSAVQFEPLTGVILSARNRIQFSLQVERIPEFDLMAKMRPMLLPVIWLEESLDLGTDITVFIRKELFGLRHKVNIFTYSAIILGLLGLAFAAYRRYDVTSRRYIGRPIPTLIEDLRPEIRIHPRLNSPKY